MPHQMLLELCNFASKRPVTGSPRCERMVTRHRQAGEQGPRSPAEVSFAARSCALCSPPICQLQPSQLGWGEATRREFIPDTLLRGTLSRYALIMLLPHMHIQNPLPWLHSQNGSDKSGCVRCVRYLRKRLRRLGPIFMIIGGQKMA